MNEDVWDVLWTVFFLVAAAVSLTAAAGSGSFLRLLATAAAVVVVAIGQEFADFDRLALVSRLHVDRMGVRS